MHASDKISRDSLTKKIKRSFIMSDQVQVDSSDNSSALINDPVFSNLHNAFQLGWSIIELKSRIQIAALSTSITGTPQAVSNTASTNLSQVQAGQTFQKVLSTVEDAKKQLLLPESQQNPTALPDSAWLTSLWRATFNRIAESHKCCFPNSTTAGSLYNLPSPLSASKYDGLLANPQAYDASSMYLPYRYLIPSNGINYSDVGVQLDKDISANFTLYDVTRRALNCLTLLYTNPEVSLIPDTVNDFQGQLVQNVIKFNQLNAVINNPSQPGQTQGGSATSDQPGAPEGNETPGNQIPTSAEDADLDPKNEAIQLLSKNAISFLETWDTYARETLYVRGGEDAQVNEIQLVAYEAGRAMASLSWGITTTIVPIENALNNPKFTVSIKSQNVKDETVAQQQETNGDRKPQQQQIMDDSKAQQQHLTQVWLEIFSDRSIASIQQQISALSTMMDDAYYRVHPNISRPNPNDLAERTNLALPSQTIQAIIFSLDYWKRAVRLICNEQPDTNSDTSSSSGNPKTVAIPSMNWQTSRTLHLALVQQAEIWQPLLLHQQSLLNFTTQYVTQRILNDFMSDFEQAAGQEIQNEIRKFRTPLIIGGGVIFVLLVSLVLLFIFSQSSYQVLVSGFALVVGGIVGFFGTVVARFRSVLSPSISGANTAQGPSSPISAIPGMAGDALVEAFQNGYKQILIEFDYLNHNVSITYPLIESFILYSDQLAKKIKTDTTQANTPNRNNISERIVFLFSGKIKESPNNNPVNEVTTEVVYLIKDAYDFLTKIAWTNQERKDEIGRIARAAFGPIGAFIGAQLSLSSAQKNKSSISK
jgi:hypothetical protein